MLPSLGIACGEDEYLWHHAYSVYVEDFPLASSAGYFCPFIDGRDDGRRGLN
jgi:hypothetical protein